MAHWIPLVWLRQKISLTAAISILLTLVAIVPLLVTVVSSQLLSRPQLISQSTNAMAQDAHTRVQLIDSYLLDRLQDVQIASSLFAVQAYAQGNEAFKQPALDTLAVNDQNDVDYDSWSILDLQGRARLWYPTPPKMHGKYLIPPADLDRVQRATQALFSGVFYDTNVGLASIVIYMPIIGSSSNVVGIVRAEIVLNYIWSIVNSQADNAGSYAFILDQRGVRVAYASIGGSTLARSSHLFTAIAPLTPAQQRQATEEDLYGSDGKAIAVFPDATLVNAQNDPHAPSRFDMVPAGQQESYEVVKVHIAVVSWTYFALRPIKAIISIADQQLFTTLLIAMIVLCLAIIIGLLTGRSITQPILRSMEQEHRAYVQQQNLNQLKDQILLNVSHELRTPLTEVYGYLELISEHYAKLDDETKKTFIRRAIGGCEELQLLVGDVLNTLRTDDQSMMPDLQMVPLDPMVHEVLELFDPRTIQNYDLHITIPDALLVQADPRYLRQILRNLLSNAFKYTPAHTTVAISAAPFSSPAEENSSSPLLCICVKDNGPGIAAEDIPLLFEKFGRLKRDLSSSIRGVGLGLYISKQMVEAMGGHIWVESAGIPGQGSQFCFVLPLALETPRENDAQANHADIVQE